MLEGLFISQSKYVFDLLIRFKMDNCKPCATPFLSVFKFTKDCASPKFDATIYQQFASSLIYLTQSWHDISFIISVVFVMNQVPKEHKNIIRSSPCLDNERESNNKPL